MAWYGLNWFSSESEPVAGRYEHDNEPSGFRKLLGNSWVALQVLSCLEGLSPMKLIAGFLNWKCCPCTDFDSAKFSWNVCRIPITKTAVADETQGAGFFWRERGNKGSQFGRTNTAGPCPRQHKSALPPCHRALMCLHVMEFKNVRAAVKWICQSEKVWQLHRSRGREAGGYCVVFTLRRLQDR